MLIFYICSVCASEKSKCTVDIVGISENPVAYRQVELMFENIAHISTSNVNLKTY